LKQEYVIYMFTQSPPLLWLQPEPDRRRATWQCRWSHVWNRIIRTHSYWADCLFSCVSNWVRVLCVVLAYSVMCHHCNRLRVKKPFFRKT